MAREEYQQVTAQLAQATAAGFGAAAPEQRPVANQLATSPGPAPPEQRAADDNMAEQLQQTQGQSFKSNHGV